jgi:hypothetical protein
MEIQVKTTTDTGNRTLWPLGGVTSAFATSEHEWFVFVLLPKLPMAPRAFVVPRDMSVPRREPCTGTGGRILGHGGKA